MKDNDRWSKLTSGATTVTNSYAYKEELGKLSKACEGRDRELAEAIFAETEARRSMDDQIAELSAKTCDTVVTLSDLARDMLVVQGKAHNDIERLKRWLGAAIGFDFAAFTILLVQKLML